MPRKKQGSFCTWGLDHQGLGRVSWHDFEYLEKLCDTSSCAKANFEVYQAAGKWISEAIILPTTNITHHPWKIGL